MIYPPRKKTAVGNAHSKVILIGEHSVVYGKPAIAVPLNSLNVQVFVEESTGPIYMEIDNYSGPAKDAPRPLKGLAACIDNTLQTLNKKKSGLKFTIKSFIPIGRGLGSSAAIAIAIVRGIYNFYNQQLAHQKLMELVHIAETYAHGNPSGIDMAAASSEHPIWFEKEKNPKQIIINRPFYLTIADTGRVGETRLAVESIKANMQENPDTTRKSIDLLGEYTIQAKNSLLNGNILQLGNILTLAQIELDKLGVSDSGINLLVKTATEAGALGAKLTGGGRGGCMIALSDTEHLAKAIGEKLLDNGAKKTWCIQVGEHKQVHGT